MIGHDQARALWERRGAGATLLGLLVLPLSWLYRLAVQWRNALFDRGWLKAAALPRPVISVGNLTVGGTGKTPTCLWLAQELKAHGLRVGILSRGYRGKNRKPAVIPAPNEIAHGPEELTESLIYGDEPVMMARLYGQHVAVGKNRSGAAAALLRAADVDLFILDDGFQHRSIRRDVDLLLLGAELSGRLLPAGPFREPKKNLRRAHFLLLTGAAESWKKQIPQRIPGLAYVASLQPVCLVGVDSDHPKEYPLTALYRSKILTVTGIAAPQNFYRMIHEWEGEIVDTLEFPDHHRYSPSDWQEITRRARAVDLIITTEKDILKLQRFPFAKEKLLALRVAMEVEGREELVPVILERIKPVAR
jgi:tetraacyldisaccharide 4'-kinase